MFYTVLRIILALLVLAGAFFCVALVEEFIMGIRVYAAPIAIFNFAYVGFVLERPMDPLGYKPFSFEVLLLTFFYFVVFFCAEKWDLDFLRVIHFVMSLAIVLTLEIALIGLDAGLVVKLAALAGMGPFVVVLTPFLIVAFIIWYVFSQLF